MAKTIVQEFTKGLWDEIPPFRLVLGLCPTLAVTKTVENGIGMGVAFTFVLRCSNILVPALPRPPTSTWDLTTTRPPNSSAICLASLAVDATRPFGIGTPYFANNCFD